jgi:hypothetical protein
MGDKLVAGAVALTLLAVMVLAWPSTTLTVGERIFGVKILIGLALAALVITVVWAFRELWRRR